MPQHSKDIPLGLKCYSFQHKSKKRDKLLVYIYSITYYKLLYGIIIYSNYI